MVLHQLTFVNYLTLGSAILSIQILVLFLIILKVKCSVVFGDRSFSIAAPKLWNSLLATLCLKLLCKNIIDTMDHSGKSGMQNIVLFTIRSTKM